MRSGYQAGRRVSISAHFRVFRCDELLFHDATCVRRGDAHWRREADGRFYNSALLVNFPAVADMVQKDASLHYIKLVKHPVIASSQPVLHASLQSFVGKGFQACAHLIHFAPHSFPDRGRKIIEGTGKSGRPDLERRSHDSLGLVGRVIPGGDFATGLIELRFYLVR